MVLMLLVAVLTLGIAAFLASEVVTYPQRRRETSVRRATSYGRSRREARRAEVAGFHERVIGPSVRKLAATTLKLNPKTSVDSIGSKLITSGLASRVTTTQFLAFKTGLAMGGVVVSIVFGAIAGPLAGIVFMAVLAMLGFFLPHRMLRR